MRAFAQAQAKKNHSGEWSLLQGDEV